MVFVKQKKKNMRYKNFLSDNFFKFTIRAVCRNPRRYQGRCEIFSVNLDLL